MRLVSWNILQGGGQRAADIGKALLALQPDVLALQEFRNGKSAPLLLDALQQLGLVHLASNGQALGSATDINTASAKNTVLIASRWPLLVSHWGAATDSQLAIKATVASELVDLDLYAGHLPHKRRQIPYFNALLSEPVDGEHPGLIIGDLNCGIPFEDSDTKTFDNTHLFQQLLRQGWVDAWRSRHGTLREFTWVSPRGNGYRYDHCLCTAEMNTYIESVEYRHDLREAGLSDHSALVVEFS